MSQQADRFRDRTPRCSCGRPVLIRVRGGALKTLPDHDLCRACWRDQQNRLRPVRAPLDSRTPAVRVSTP